MRGGGGGGELQLAQGSSQHCMHTDASPHQPLPLGAETFQAWLSGAEGHVALQEVRGKGAAELSEVGLKRGFWQVLLDTQE